MSLTNEVSVEELNQISDELKALLKERPELSVQINSVKRNLLKMKVALSELEELREEYSKGDLTDDSYFTRRKKLKMDFMIAKDNISDDILSQFIDQVKDKTEKSRLTKIKNTITSNKDFISFLFQLFSIILSKT